MLNKPFSFVMFFVFITPTEQYRELVEKVMEEGVVEVTIIKVLCIGASGVGKTCVKHLLLGLPPPKKRTTTPIATRAAWAISRSRIVVEGKEVKDTVVTWTEVGDQALVDFIADAVQHFSCQKAATQLVSPPEDSRSEPESNLNTCETSLEVQEGSLLFELSAAEAVDEDHPHFAETDDVPNPKIHSVERVTTSIVMNPRRAKVQPPQDWVYFVDSGGQREFVDVLPCFIRGSTVYLIVTRMDQRLTDNLTYEYVNNDRHICKPTRLQQTQLEFIEVLIRSLSAVKYKKSTMVAKPKFLIVGTHADKHHPLFTETLSGKNRLLEDRLGEVKEMCIMINEDIVFPLNSVATSEMRETFASILRQHISQAHLSPARVRIPILGGTSLSWKLPGKQRKRIVVFSVSLNVKRLESE